jgi:prolipoprotein diacylglyceryl transferase
VTTTVLAYFPSPAQGVWYLGPFPIRAYALCIIAGIIVALLIGDRRWAARGGERGVIYDIALWAVPFGLIGGRIYHLMTDWKTYFGPGGAGVGAALRIWEGGLGIWGAVAFGGVGAWIACRRRGIPLPAFGDAVAPGIVLAQAIGRLGNYFNQELYGRETTVPWGMEIFYRRDWSGVVDVHSLDGVSTGQVAAVVHPTFLYELLWNVLVFFMLIWADRRFRLGHGRLFALYVAGYSVGRFWVELMRDDTATHIAGIRINVFTATFVFIGAVVYMLLAPKGREDPETLRGKQPPEGAEGESAVEEWAEDLVAAAKGSGIVAAATVAGEHEDEDAAAVGDLEEDLDEDLEEAAEDAAEFVDEVQAEEMAVEADLEAELADATVEEDMEVEAVEVTEAEAQVLSEQAVHDLSLAAEAEAEAEVDQEAETAADSDDGPVVVYEAAPEADTVVVYADGTDQAVETAEAEVETAEAEPEVRVEVEPEVEAEAEVEPEVEAEAEVEPELEVEIEPEAEAEIEPEPEAEAEIEPDVEVAAEPQPEPDAPKLGSTLKRLLWGVGNRSGD